MPYELFSQYHYVDNDKVSFYIRYKSTPFDYTLESGNLYGTYAYGTVDSAKVNSSVINVLAYADNNEINSVNVYKKTLTDVSFVLVGNAIRTKDALGFESFSLTVDRSDIGITTGLVDVKYVPVDLAGTELELLASVESYGFDLDQDCGFRYGNLLAGNEVVIKFGGLGDEVNVAADGGTLRYYFDTDPTADPDGLLNDGETYVYRFSGASSTDTVRIVAVTNVTYRVWWSYLEVPL